MFGRFGDFLGHSAGAERNGRQPCAGQRSVAAVIYAMMFDIGGQQSHALCIVAADEISETAGNKNFIQILWF